MSNFLKKPIQLFCFSDVVLLGMVPLGLIMSVFLMTTLPLSTSCVSDHRRLVEGCWLRSLKSWTERLLVVALRIILQPKSTWVINISTLLSVSFGKYNSFNPSYFHLSLMTEAYSEAGTKSWFQEVFSSDIYFSSSENALFMCNLISSWRWVWVIWNFMSLLNDKIFLSKLGIGDLSTHL